jgi:hypothetical protein
VSSVSEPSDGESFVISPSSSVAVKTSVVTSESLAARRVTGSPAAGNRRLRRKETETES